MDTVQKIWSQNSNSPLLVSTTRKAGKSELLCNIAVEHLQLGRRVCVITTSRHMVISLTNRIAVKCRLKNGVTTVKSSTKDPIITYNDVWLQCIIGKACDAQEIISEADLILVDDAPYVDPVWFRDCLLQYMQATPSVVFGTPTSNTNHFTLMCNARQLVTVK
jgi:hypothetical protein